VVLFSAPAAWACTTFLAQHAGQPVFGKGYDWDQGAGLVVTNARGLQRTGGQHKADIIARLRVRDGGP
jgi:penicillin V acylase-like amidase (Ntn superfamily)